MIERSKKSHSRQVITPPRGVAGEKTRSAAFRLRVSWDPSSLEKAGQLKLSSTKQRGSRFCGRPRNVACQKKSRFVDVRDRYYRQCWHRRESSGIPDAVWADHSLPISSLLKSQQRVLFLSRTENDCGLTGKIRF